MPRRDRENLAELFVWRAESRASDHREESISSIALAERIAGDSATILRAIGLYWLRDGMRTSREEVLNRACRYFQRALEIKPKFRLALWEWAAALTQLAVITGELNYFVDAEEKFSTVEWKKLPAKHRRLKFLWDWALKWSRSGEMSGEPVDYQLAIEKFELAEKQGFQEVEFLVDYGRAVLSLASLISEPRFFMKALQLFMAAVKKAERHSVAWFGMGTVLQFLFEKDGDREYFQRANQAFEAAALTSQDDPQVVLAWARHLLRGGEMLDDAHLLQKGLNLLERLDETLQNEPDVLEVFLRAMTLLGSVEERLDLLHRAEALCRDVLKRSPGHTGIRCELGDVLVAQGHYFSESRFFRQAMEHYARALAHDPDCVAAHMGMAQAGYPLGAMTRELAFLEKSARHLRRAVDLEPRLSEGWTLWALTQLKSAEITDSAELANEGVGYFQKALDLQGGVDSCSDIELLFNYGCALDYIGTFGEDEGPHRQAVDLLRRVASRRGEDGMTHFHLGLAWLHLAEVSLEVDDYQQAAESFARACAFEPEEGVIWDEWGCSLLSLASMVHDPTLPHHALLLRQQAEEKLRRAVALGHAQSLYHLACCACQLGDFAIALDYLRKAKQRGGLPSLDHLMHDEWLAALREHPSFAAFVASL